MTLEDQYRMYVGAYYGVQGLDDYELKCYLLKDIENYIRDFIELNPIKNFDYKKEAAVIENTVSQKRKLQDCLLALPQVNASMEVILLIQNKIRKIND